MADAAEWIGEFRQLHERYKKDELTGDVRKNYMDAREKFASALLGAQGLQAQEGQSARQTFRVAQAFQVELKPREGDAVRAVTLDLSMKGFSTVLAQPPAIGETQGFALKLPGGDPITGGARMVSAKKQPGNFRASFAFERVTDPELIRLETVLFDCVLARMPK